MSDQGYTITLGQFALGLFVIAAIVSIADFTLFASPGLANSVGFGVGAVVGSVFLGAIVWAVFRLLFGSNKSPEPKKFFLIFSMVICGLYVLLYGSGFVVQ